MTDDLNSRRASDSRNDFRLSRRAAITVVGACCGSAVLARPNVVNAKTTRPKLKGLIGITTGSFTRHLSRTPQADKLVLLDLPRIMHDEYDLQVLDLMTANIPTLAPKYLDKLRRRAEDSKCIITNFKMNQKNIDMGSEDDATRKHAVDVYKRTIDAAERLGCRWVRPLPRAERPNVDQYVGSYRELIDYATPKGITLLIENFGWMQNDPEAIPRMMKRVGQGLDASVDTGNWTNEARYEGLKNTFPLAVTCDFKAYQLGENNEHPRYDLKRCFQTGWDAGYRGPWCFEHFNKSLPNLWKGMAYLRDSIKLWTKEADVAAG